MEKAFVAPKVGDIWYWRSMFSGEEEISAHYLILIEEPIIYYAGTPSAYCYTMLELETGCTSPVDIHVSHLKEWRFVS